MSVEAMRQNGHASRIRRGRGAVSNLIPLNGMVRYRSGILIFSPQELLHANRRAWKLISHFNQVENGSVCEGCPEPVCKLRNAVQAALAHRRAANIWEPFELKHILFESSRKVLVRGFGLADRNAHHDSRIVIVLEEFGSRQEHSDSQRQVTGRSQERRDAMILGSAQLGSDRGVFNVCTWGSP